MNRLKAIGIVFTLLLIAVFINLSNADPLTQTPVLVVSGTVTDAQGKALGAGIQVEVTNDDRGLKATGVTDTNGKYIVTLTDIDPVGGLISTSIGDTITVKGTQGVISGSKSYKLVADDINTAQITINIIIGETTQPFRFTKIGDKSADSTKELIFEVNEGTELRLILVAEGGKGNLIYSVTPMLTGAKIEGNTFIWTPDNNTVTFDEKQKDFKVTLSVTDGSPKVEQKIIIRVKDVSLPISPSLSNVEVSQSSIEAGQNVTVTVTLLDTNNKPTSGRKASVSFAGLSETIETGLTDAQGQAKTIVKSLTKVGLYTITVTVLDGGPIIDKKPSLTVTPGPPKKIIIDTPKITDKSVAIKVNVFDNFDNSISKFIYHWKLNEPFPASGPAGGNKVSSEDIATIRDLKNNQTYTVYVALADNNGNLLSPSVSSDVTFTMPDNPPVANPQSVTTNEGVPVDILLTGTDVDGDLLQYKVIQQPSHGTLEGNAPNLKYTPNTGFIGEDNFVFVVNDGTVDSQPAPITIKVGAIKPSLSILTPINGQAFPTATTSVTLSVSISNHKGAWQWKLNEDFPTSGTAGGNPVTAGSTANITGLEDGKTYTVYVSLVDGNGKILTPAIKDSVTFSVTSKKDFSVLPVINNVIVKPGENAIYIIKIIGINGFADNITLSADMPADLNAVPVFQPKKLTLSALQNEAQSQLTITIPKDAKPKDYEFQIIARSDVGIAHDAALYLTVEEIGRAWTSLTIDLQPTKVTFMEELRVSGYLVAEQGVDVSNAAVTVTFKSPSGKPHETYSLITDAKGKYQIKEPFIPNELGEWSVESKFEGNEQLKPFVKNISFTVEKGKSNIAFELTSEPVFGGEIKFDGNLVPKLKGELLSLIIIKPEGGTLSFQNSIKTEELGVFHIDQSNIRKELKFDEPGDWKITVSWNGNDYYLPCEKKLPVSIEENLGKAIIVLGGGDQKNNKNWKEFNSIATNDVYKVFAARKFDDKKDIYFLSPDTNLTKVEDKVVADNVTSEKALEYAITVWAKENVNKYVPLYIYLLSHEIGDQFLLEKHGEYEVYLNPTQLDLWLDQLPADIPIIVVIESCYSGSFIRTSDGKPTDLVKVEEGRVERVVITSCRSDQQTNVSSALSFSKLFFNRIRANDTLDKAFNNTLEQMKRNYFLKGQVPQMDSDGDANSNTSFDYTNVSNRYFPGNFYSGGIPPNITDFTQSQVLPKGTKSLRIYAKVTSTEITRVFATIIPPSFDPNAQFTDWSQIDFPQFDLTKVSGKDNEYEFTYDGFTMPGNYTIILNAENPDGNADPVEAVITFSESIIKGDVNGDGKIGANDAILVLQIVAGLQEPTEYQTQAGDMNGDGKLSSNDAILILRKSVGMPAPSLLVGTQREVKLTINGVNGTAGESITASLKVDNAKALASGEIRITYNSSVLRAVGVSCSDDILSASNIAVPGVINLAFASVDGLNSDKLADVQFEVLADGMASLSFENVNLYGLDTLPLKSNLINGKFISSKLMPKQNLLMQNYPNPFNPETWIPYQLAKPGDVTIRIYNANGQLIRTLALGQKPSGIYIERVNSAYWDGMTDYGESVSSGVYFYNIQAGKYRATRKMIVVR